MKRAYEALLRLYPYDYRALFAPEMSSAFEATANECRAQGGSIFVRFVLAELTGLVLGAWKEWIAKLTTGSAIRGRCLPDRRLMRPPGVPWDSYYAGAWVSTPPKRSERCTLDISR